MSKKKVCVTGAAGFIGFHVAQRLLNEGREVVGVDSVNDYYDPRLKEARLEILGNHRNFSFVKLDLADRAASKSLFVQKRVPVVIHLGGSSWGPLFTAASSRLCRCKYRRLYQCTRGVPSQWLQTSAVRLVVLGLWRER